MTKAGLTTNPDEEWEAFKDYHAMKGSRFADWAAAWRTWCRNAAKWQKEKVPVWVGAGAHSRMTDARRIGFTVPKRQPDAVIQALKDNEDAAREAAGMTEAQKQAAIRKLGEIWRSIK